MQRREFLKVASAAAGSCAAAPCTLLAAQALPAVGGERAAELPRRVLGKTGEKLSVIGFPGLALSQQGQEEGAAGIRKAFDEGINYFDVAPAYGRDGECEIKMGVGLEGIDRSKIFLACKTKKRDKQGAREELERSLTRLKTDHFDLYQAHAVFTPEEARQALGPGGALETFLKAKEEGKVRYLGLSAHTTKGAIEMLKGYPFDSIMFPIDFVDYLQWGFGKTVIECARERGVAVFAMKTLCAGAWPQGATRTRKWWYRTVESQDEIDLAVRFSLSQAGVVAAIPPSFLDLVDKAIVAGRSYRPITDAEVARLQELGTGRGSVFKADEERVAMGLPLHRSFHLDSPHGYCPCVHV
ncbi:MAG TPA: aldo/keto reductase [Sedimentisphaerales bacterium]|nr:aldo/keto reductase [Sedimentisphaerales bacterium]HNU28509.1 aldo/keto reductase [Sedimentisphaerales bacterium]